MDDGIAKNMNDLPDSLKPIVKGGGSLTAFTNHRNTGW
jgi:F-type H+-transporting ATPase subunit alpha